MGRNLHWSIILASEDQHPGGDGILDALAETEHWLGRTRAFGPGRAPSDQPSPGRCVRGFGRGLGEAGGDRSKHCHAMYCPGAGDWRKAA